MNILIGLIRRIACFKIVSRPIGCKNVKCDANMWAPDSKNSDWRNLFCTWGGEPLKWLNSGKKNNG